MAKFPDHIPIDYGFIGCTKEKYSLVSKTRTTGKFENMNALTAAKLINKSLIKQTHQIRLPLIQYAACAKSYTSHFYKNTFWPFL